MYEQLVKRGAAACVALGIAVVALATQTPAQAADAWSPSADCAACHTSQAKTVEEDTHEILACVGCHNDEKALADVHKDADASSKMPRRLKKTEVTEATCLSCHGDDMIAAPQVKEDETTAADAKGTDAKGTTNPKETTNETSADAEEVVSRKALIAATTTSVALTDKNGVVVNPHDLPTVEDHSSITCVTCHKGHTDDTIDESAMKACVLCHHESVFECYTCHE